MDNKLLLTKIWNLITSRFCKHEIAKFITIEYDQNGDGFQICKCGKRTKIKIDLENPTYGESMWTPIKLSNKQLDKLKERINKQFYNVVDNYKHPDFLSDADQQIGYSKALDWMEQQIEELESE